MGAGEMEEARSLLDSAERGKRQTEAELAESRNAVNEMTSINSKAASDKRSLEGAVHTMHAEIDDMLQQAKNSRTSLLKSTRTRFVEDELPWPSWRLVLGSW